MGKGIRKYQSKCARCGKSILTDHPENINMNVCFVCDMEISYEIGGMWYMLCWLWKNYIRGTK